MLLKLISLFGVLAGASVTVRKTGQGPTGYDVTFHYENATAKSVTIGSGLQFFTDSYHATTSGSALWDPRDYQPGWFFSNYFGPPSALPYQMKNLENGSWVYTTPLPSGTYNYALLVDCPGNTTCDIDGGKYVIDPDEPPFLNVKGDQTQSTFKVPFDPGF